jgi:hypothetical protein
MSAELNILKEHFKVNCPTVKVVSGLEEKSAPHWKRLMFNNGLNTDELISIGNYITKYFYVEGLYIHLQPKVCVYNGYLCLTIDVNNIDMFLK